MGKSQLEKTSSDDWEILDTTSIIAEIKAETEEATLSETADAIAYAYSAARAAAEMVDSMTGKKSVKDSAKAITKHRARLENMRHVLRTAEASKADAIKTANSAASHLASLVNEYDNSDHSIATKSAIVTATAALRVAIMDVKRANCNVECARDILEKYMAHTAAY